MKVFRTTNHESIITIIRDALVPCDGISVEKGRIGFWIDERFRVGVSAGLGWSVKLVAQIVADGIPESVLRDLVCDGLGGAVRYVYHLAPDGSLIEENWLDNDPLAKIAVDLRQMAENQYDAFLNDPSDAPDGLYWAKTLSEIADRIDAASGNK